MKRKIIASSVILLFFSFGFIPGINSSSDNMRNSIDLSDGLVGYWSFDFETAVDESGNNNHGSIHDANIIDGVSGLAYSYDGSDDNIKIKDSPNLRFDDTQEFTISAWIFIYNMESHKLIIACKGGETIHNKGYSFVIPKKYDILQFQLYDQNSNEFRIRGIRELEVNAWYHVGVTWEEGSVKLYINGDIDNSTHFDVDVPSTNTDLYFGNNAWNDHFFSGIIDEVRIFNRALNIDEIKELNKKPHGNLYNVLFFGTINNLNTDVGDLIIFEVIKIRGIQLSPFGFNLYSPGDKFRIKENYLGILTPGFIMGLFQVKI